MSQFRRQRLLRRFLIHHLPLLALSALGIASLYYTRPYRDVLSRASFATAYPALVLLAATLLIGPYNVLQKRRNAISSDLRRDIGVWAGILSIAHSLIGQNVHLRGRPWLYYLYEHRERHTIPLRHDLFGFSNYTGLWCLIVLIVLLATSNDYSLRRMGTPRWKQLQRWNYLAFAFAAAHAVGYLITEKQRMPYVVVVAICILLTLSLQTAGFLMRKAALANVSQLRRTQPQ